MATTISSRTPEGLPNHCPLCGARVCVEPSRPAGDAPCPGCGTLLWFLRTSAGVQCYEAKGAAPVWQRIAEILCANLGINRESIADPETLLRGRRLDSIDVLELIMELEEEFEVTVPDDQAEQVRTVADAVDRIVRQRL